MSSVSQRLKDYSEKMSVKFLISYIQAVAKLEHEMGNYLQKYISTKGFELDFTSGEIRHFIDALSKTHKSLNKIVSYTELRKKFNKYDLVGAEELKKELRINIEMIRLVSRTQTLLAAFHRYKLLLGMLEESMEVSKQLKEKERLKEEEESDEIFRHTIYEALVGACE